MGHHTGKNIKSEILLNRIFDRLWCQLHFHRFPALQQGSAKSLLMIHIVILWNIRKDPPGTKQHWHFFYDSMKYSHCLPKFYVTQKGCHPLSGMGPWSHRFQTSPGDPPVEAFISHYHHQLVHTVTKLTLPKNVSQTATNGTSQTFYVASEQCFLLSLFLFFLYFFVSFCIVLFSFWRGRGVTILWNILTTRKRVASPSWTSWPQTTKYC